jgi:hypothetical protein
MSLEQEKVESMSKVEWMSKEKLYEKVHEKEMMKYLDEVWLKLMQ